MKTIKKVALKDATRLSQEEMKLVFGGSGGESGLTSCSTTCGTQPSVSMTNCRGRCEAFDGSGVQCVGPTRVYIKFCNGTSSFNLEDLM